MNQHTQPDTSPDSETSWRIHVSRYFFITLITALIILAAAFSYWRAGVVNELEAEISHLHAQGLPFTPEELDAYLPPVPDDQNAALIWLEVAKLIQTLPDRNAQNQLAFVGSMWRSESNPDRPEPWQHYTDEQLAGLEHYIALNQPALQHAILAIPLTHSRYPGKLSEQVLDPNSRHTTMIRDLARHLNAAKELAIRTNDPQAAARYLHAMFALANSIEQEPLIVNQLVCIAVRSLTFAGLERLLNFHPLDDPTLSDLSAQLAHAESIPYLKRGLIGEMSYFNQLFEYGRGSAAPDSRWTYEFLRFAGFMQTNQHYSALRIRRLREAADLPYIDRLRVAREIESEADDTGLLHFVGALAIPPMETSFKIEARSIAQFRTALIAIAIERYRLANNDHLPETLDQLVPTYLESVPLDPFTDQPLHYIRTSENHYTVYATGIDLADDGGSRYNAEGDEFEPGSDIVFQVRR